MTRPDPMADGTLAALAKRVETEEPSYDLWRAVFLAVRPQPRITGCLSGNDWDSASRRFDFLIIHRAYLDAADMLRVPGWTIYEVVELGDKVAVVMQSLQHEHPQGGRATGEKALARAWLAANLRSRAATESGNGQ